jgi:hypothetical protein
MTMRRLIAGAIATTALAACSTAPPAGVYAKPGMTAEERARDQAECAATAAAGDNARSLTLTSAEREAVDACMRARGYSRVANRRG